FAPKYLMLTDADIVHAPDTLRWLVAHAEANGLVLASLTARWRCENLPERVHIPAFIYYFAMLYPFAWVNRPDHPMAGAAGRGRVGGGGCAGGGRRLQPGARGCAACGRQHRRHPRCA